MNEQGGDKQAADFIWQDYQCDREQYKPTWLFLYVMKLHNRQEAGYKIEPDDLTDEEWDLLSEFKTALNNYQMEKIRRK